MNTNLVETRLLEATLAGDDASRDVYADWLEGNADLDRADFLRVQREVQAMAGDDPRYDWRIRRLHALRVKIDPAWLARVDTNPILPFEVELAARLAQQPAQTVEPVVPPPPLPPPPPRRPLRVESTWPTSFPPVPDNRVPRWITISSALAGSALVIAFVLYALVG